MKHFKNKVIKHEKNTDVAFKVEAVLFNENKWKLRGVWINIAYPKHFVADDRKDVIAVHPQDVDNWKEYEINLV